MYDVHFSFYSNTIVLSTKNPISDRVAVDDGASSLGYGTRQVNSHSYDQLRSEKEIERNGQVGRH